MDIEIVAKNYTSALKASPDILHDNRKNSHRYAVGRFDKRGVRYPLGIEHQPCCDKVRQPTRKYPFGLLRHCLTKKHVYNLLGVSTLHV